VIPCRTVRLLVPQPNSRSKRKGAPTRSGSRQRGFLRDSLEMPGSTARAVRHQIACPIRWCRATSGFRRTQRVSADGGCGCWRSTSGEAGGWRSRDGGPRWRRAQRIEAVGPVLLPLHSSTPTRRRPRAARCWGCHPLAEDLPGRGATISPRSGCDGSVPRSRYYASRTALGQPHRQRLFPLFLPRMAAIPLGSLEDQPEERSKSPAPWLCL